MIRKAYFEHPNYVPLLHRAFDEWRNLESISGQKLMHLCGLMLAGDPNSTAISGARQAAREHSLPLENLDANEATSRFPGMQFRDDMEVVFEADAGFVDVEKCVSAYIESAQARGAELRLNQPVVSWQAGDATVTVRTQDEVFEAASIIVTAGAWTSQILDSLGLPLTVLRKLLFWHKVESDDHNLERGQPGFFYETKSGTGASTEIYGFPSIDGQTIKIAEHTGGREVVEPLNVDRDVHPEDCHAIEAFLPEFMPFVEPRHVRHAVCMYTNSPDGHFIIDRHPEHPNVVIGAGFSGHGFKFVSGLGAALADLATSGQTDQPIGFLSIGSR